MQTASTRAPKAAAACAKIAHMKLEAAVQWLLEGQVPDPARPTALDMRRAHKQPMRAAGQHVQPCDKMKPKQLRRARSVSRVQRCQKRHQARDKTTCAAANTENERQTMETYGASVRPERAFKSASENFEDFSCCVVRARHKVRAYVTLASSHAAPNQTERCRPKLETFQTPKEVWLATALKLAPPRMGQRKL